MLRRYLIFLMPGGAAFEPRYSHNPGPALSTTLPLWLQMAWRALSLSLLQFPSFLSTLGSLVVVHQVLNDVCSTMN